MYAKVIIHLFRPKNVISNLKCVKYWMLWSTDWSLVSFQRRHLADYCWCDYVYYQAPKYYFL